MRFIDRGKVDRIAGQARDHASLALDSLRDIPETTDPNEVSDLLAAADTHLHEARRAVEAAFRGIDA